MAAYLPTFWFALNDLCIDSFPVFLVPTICPTYYHLLFLGSGFFGAYVIQTTERIFMLVV